jgi:type IV pilus assembly protein PilA
MSRTNRKGFTLVELAVVIVIIGVLAAFGVPQFLKSVERSKAAEAFNYLSAVRAAQERYLAKEGVYCDDTNFAGGTGSSCKLDINQVSPKYFDVGAMVSANAGGGSSNWSLTLTRKSESSSYGQYEVTFNQEGYDSTGAAYSGTGGTLPISGISDINPMGN